MKTLVESTGFRKDLKRVKKRGYDREKHDAVIRKLQSAATLPASNPNFPLSKSIASSGESVGDLVVFG
jgi:mRNA-degrading endonuclease YafQ of YafQ-DinJ toxin-antitoxin module